MSILKIDFSSISSPIIEAFTIVYGQEYHEFITEKINKTLIMQYLDIAGLNAYISYIKKCKNREFSIKFLDKLGIDVEKYKKENYTTELDPKIEKILSAYIGRSDAIFNKKIAGWNAPILAFDKENDNEEDVLLNNKIMLINYLREEGASPINYENFSNFTETEEYKEILKKIQGILAIYNELSEEYEKWEQCLEEFQRFKEEEKEKQIEIFSIKKNNIFKSIFPKLPPIVTDKLANQNPAQQQRCILGITEIDKPTLIEYFSSENMELIKSSNISIDEKRWIISRQKMYLLKLGIDLPDDITLSAYNSEDDIKKYLDFIEQDGIKEYIPSKKIVEQVKKIREEEYADAILEYQLMDEDFFKMALRISPHGELNPAIIKIIKEKLVCILGNYIRDENNELVPLMFHTIREYDYGILCYSLMHEYGHVIDLNYDGTGFERKEYFNILNKHNRKYRKYERFNEAINDIFTLEAFEILLSQGIYLIEPKQYTKETSDQYYKTNSITTNLLTPLIEKFREPVIKAKLTSNHEELTRYIGEYNFEELVDSVNIVDNIFRNGLYAKLNNPTDPIVIEYYNQVERVKETYNRIDEYYGNNVKRSMKNPYEKVKQKYFE